MFGRERGGGRTLFDPARHERSRQPKFGLTLLGMMFDDGIPEAESRIQQEQTGPTDRDKENYEMMRLLVQWLLSAIALMVVSHFVPGFFVRGLVPALVASLVIGLLNATVGLFLKIITFPISILTLGLFLLVINGLMILVASSIVRGFRVNGMVPAFWGAVVMALLGMLIRAITRDA